MKPWRDVLPIHPAAELLPHMDKRQLRELANDIAENGLREPVSVIDHSKHGIMLIDGINRLDAMESLGWKLVADGKLCERINKLARAMQVYERTSGINYFNDTGRFGLIGYVISKNIRRRHLTSAQKRELIGKLLKLDPKQTDLQIAKTVGVDNHTVASVRRKKEANSEIPNKTERREVGGRKARGRKPKASNVINSDDVAAFRLLREIDALDLSKLTDPISFGRALADRSHRFLSTLKKEVV